MTKPPSRESIPVVRRWPNLSEWWAEMVERPAKLREERDKAIELLTRWQYNDTTDPGPVDETADFLAGVYEREAAGER